MRIIKGWTPDGSQQCEEIGSRLEQMEQRESLHINKKMLPDHDDDESTSQNLSTAIMTYIQCSSSPKLSAQNVE